SGIRAFSPNFDVHETAKEYVLDGELPGLDKSNLSIEFTDTNTLVIHGKIERSYTSSTPPGKLLEGGKQKQAITEGKEGKEGKEEEKKSREQRAESEDEPIKYWVSERTVGSFQRSFNFPGEVDQDNVRACYENGILKVVVPKKEKRSAKKIDI
ncbi:HSP20-like chaperone, partial [Terfezia claveryi]